MQVTDMKITKTDKTRSKGNQIKLREKKKKKKKKKKKNEDRNK